MASAGTLAAAAGTAAVGRAAGHTAADTAVGTLGAGIAAVDTVADTAAGRAAAAVRTGAAQAAGIAGAQFAVAGAEPGRDRPGAGPHRWPRCSTARAAGTAGTDLQVRVSCRMFSKRHRNDRRLKKYAEREAANLSENAWECEARGCALVFRSRNTRVEYECELVMAITCSPRGEW